MPQTPELLQEIWAWKVTKRGETWVHNSLEALWSTQWVVIYACIGSDTKKILATTNMFVAGHSKMKTLKNEVYKRKREDSSSMHIAIWQSDQS